MKTATITFHGGVNEIGGNKIIIEDGDTKVLFDFGMSFTLRNQYYSVPFLSPRDEKDLLEFGILPELSGIYNFDSTEPDVDAVFLSHSHMDHAAYVSFLKREIPVHCGQTTATILNALSEARLTSFEFNLKGVKFEPFRTGDKIRLGSLEIEPIHVDHSVPGSYGFIVHTSSGTVVYTGDFRRHGSKPDLTEDFLDKSSSAEPEVVISENTNMTSVEVSSEHEVKEKLNRIIKHTSGLVLADFGCADVDRLGSFYEAAVKNGRRLAITLKQAYLLHRLGEDEHLYIPKVDDENLLIFQKTKKKYYQWEEEVMNMGKVIDSRDIAGMQDKLVSVASFCDLGELVDIKPSPGSCYILSASEPFNEEMEIDFSRLLNWLEHYGLPQFHVHVSGHITPLDLRDSLSIMKPETIFPVHGMHPELFRRFMGNIGSKILPPEQGKSYKVTKD